MVTILKHFLHNLQANILNIYYSLVIKNGKNKSEIVTQQRFRDSNLIWLLVSDSSI